MMPLCEMFAIIEMEAMRCMQAGLVNLGVRVQWRFISQVQPTWSQHVRSYYDLTAHVEVID